MRTLVTTALFVLALAGCGSNSTDSDSGPSRVEQCADRLLEKLSREGLATSETDAVRRYVRRTYCGPFASRGWVYDDGALSIDAQRWLEDAGSEVCGSADSETVKCEDEPRVVDCAILHHVRKSEVLEYVAKLAPAVECDDGTPVEQLGVP